jgi:hypothetical protein
MGVRKRVVVHVGGISGVCEGVAGGAVKGPLRRCVGAVRNCV